ncbi:MAG: hypothetical protein V1872_05920 [bacterium]
MGEKKKKEEERIKLKTMEITTEKELLEQIKIDYKNLTGEYKEIEKDFIILNQSPLIFKKIFEPALKHHIEFQSVKSLINRQTDQEKEETQYLKLELEIQIKASFVNLINYQKSLEESTALFNIRELILKKDLSEKKEKGEMNEEKGEIQAVIFISTLLLEEEKDDFYDNLKMATFLQPGSVDINPFVPRDIPIVRPHIEEKYIITGITAGNKDISAIINGQIVKIGDSIKNKCVKDIIPPNKVILNEGKKDIILTMEP